MSYVSPNTFVAGLLLPTDVPDILNDAHEFSGYPITVSANPQCPKPFFSSETGSSYCAAWCVNSCPELNPNQNAALSDVVTNDQNLVAALNAAVADAQSRLTTQTSTVTITGPVSFQVPNLASPILVSNVFRNVITYFPNNFLYPLNVTVCEHMVATLTLLISRLVAYRE